jgi:hypothetical protein
MDNLGGRGRDSSSEEYRGRVRFDDERGLSSTNPIPGVRGVGGGGRVSVTSGSLSLHDSASMPDRSMTVPMAIRAALRGDRSEVWWKYIRPSRIAMML